MFIVFEGIDGSGKSTLSRIVRDKLLEKNFKVFLDCEPTNQSEAGIKINSILKNNEKVKSYDLYNLFLEDRINHQKVLNYQINNCDFVIFDRYFLSTMAYQSNKLSLKKIWMDHQGLILPNIIFYLELDIDKAIERIQKTRSNINFFEKKEILNKINNNYKKSILFLKENSNIEIIRLNADVKSSILLEYINKKFIGLK